jgi:uncharacterized membrane protein (DUF106 family)
MNVALTDTFEVIFALLGALHPTWILVVLSLLTALLMLVIFRFSSNQKGLRAAKGRVMGQLLAIRLFPDDPWVTLRALGGALRDNVIYLRYNLTPLLVMIVPMILILIQLDLRYGRVPLRPGEAATVGVVMAPEALSSLPRVNVRPPEGLEIETPPLTISTLNEIDWRIRARKEGVYTLDFETGGKTFSKEVVVAEGDSHGEDDPLLCISSQRTGEGFIDAALYPAEARLPADLGVAHVFVDYGPRSFRILGFRMHWIVAYFVLSLGFAFLLRKPMGVEV